MLKTDFYKWYKTKASKGSQLSEPMDSIKNLFKRITSGLQMMRWEVQKTIILYKHYISPDPSTCWKYSPWTWDNLLSKYIIIKQTKRVHQLVSNISWFYSWFQSKLKENYFEHWLDFNPELYLKHSKLLWVSDCCLVIIIIYLTFFCLKIWGFIIYGLQTRHLYQKTSRLIS